MRILIAYIIFLASLAILVSLSILYTQRFRELTHYTEQVEHTHTVIIELNKLMSYLKDAETGSRGFLLSGDSTYLGPYDMAMDSLKPTYQRIATLIPKGSLLESRVQRLNILFSERLEMISHSMLLYNLDREDFKAILLRGKNKMNECRSLIDEMNAYANYTLQASKRNQNFYLVVTPGLFLVLMGFTAIAFVISFYVILREYTGKLKSQKDLEQKIVALNQSYQELEQIAHISSHDLQEPLRKMSIFCERLLEKHADGLDEEGRHLIVKIGSLSIRARDLVDTVSGYTSLITAKKEKSSVDLNTIIDAVASNFKRNLEEKEATVHFENVPTIMGYEEQVKMLFECLIENSIKYSQKQHPLHITISRESLDKLESERVKTETAHSAFTKIVYRDNGIGFDNQFAEQIFSIFQRLHRHDEIEGKGVGLAIVKRVMSNHNGFVLAHGIPEQGAAFALYFPAD
jgi:signal transduction histidine kinase